ncbi:MAG: protease inhibitor I42 family protein [Desulfarculus sp.]|nr:protease inhibitor I42 family protein [Desulfarculus sp.]
MKGQAVLIWGLLWSLLGCAGGQDGLDRSSRVSLTVGQVWELALPANPTTGYAWTLAQPPDGAVLALESQDFHPARRATPDLVGAGGTQVFLFRAVGPGATQLEAVYARPWERDQPPALRQRHAVSVR